MGSFRAYYAVLREYEAADRRHSFEAANRPRHDTVHMAAVLDRERALDRVHAVKAEIASDFLFGLRLANEIDPAALDRLLSNTPTVRKLRRSNRRLRNENKTLKKAVAAVAERTATCV